jgi:aminopeptidase N
MNNWQKIRKELLTDNHGGIHVSNRAQIVDDLFNFARAGIVDFEFAFEILEYMAKERQYVPWLAFFNGLSHLTRRFGAEMFRNYVLTVLEPIYDHIEFYPRINDTQTQIYTRNNVLAWLCRYGHEDCLMNAKYEYGKFIEAYL